MFFSIFQTAFRRFYPKLQIFCKFQQNPSGSVWANNNDTKTYKRTNILTLLCDQGKTDIHVEYLKIIDLSTSITLLFRYTVWLWESEIDLSCVENSVEINKHSARSAWSFLYYARHHLRAWELLISSFVVNNYGIFTQRLGFN